MEQNIQYSDADVIIKAFEGAIHSRSLSHTDRVFAMEITFHLDHPRLAALGSRKPPLHLHPYQDEYVEVLEGVLAVEVEGREHLLAAPTGGAGGGGGGEFRIGHWANHRLYPPSARDYDQLSPGPAGMPRVTRILLSGQDTPEILKLDDVFFQNWYGYQDQIMLKGGKFDLIQVMCMFDAGGSYLSLPWWIPFSRTVARVGGILVGRWLGGLLGYRPFYRRFTTEELWPVACEKMQSSRFYRSWTSHPKMK